MSFQAQLDNRSPFVAELLPMPDGEGGERVLIVARASFAFALDGTLELAEEPEPVRMADAFTGAPGLSSTAAEHDLALFKPRCDLLVNAEAHAPYGQPATEVEVEVRVGSLLQKRAVVRGDRHWVDDRPSEPAPFVTLPLTWERAFGGSVGTGEDLVAELRNPVGVGFRGARSADEEVPTLLPNVEAPGEGLSAPHRASSSSTPTPVGFGPVGRGWQPRLPLAGTYDEGWKQRRWPLRPRDYDPRWEQAAPEDQQLDDYPAGERVQLSNLSPGGIWIFNLPHVDLPAYLLYDEIGDLRGARRCERVALRVDTVEIDGPARTLGLVARASVPVERGRPPLRDVVLGHPTPGWLRAKRYGKCYLDRGGHGGTDPKRPCFWL